MRSLSILVHGDSKVGKTWFTDTTPAPRLILDAEGGNQWTPSVKTYWNPMAEPPPQLGIGRQTENGPEEAYWWDTCIVIVRNYETVARVYEWLATGQHVFRSVGIDSISEIQKRCKDNIAGLDQMKTQDWGQLLTHMENLIRNFRDLTMHPTKPLEAVVLIAFTRETGGKFRPYVQGQLAITMPYFIDVIGYLYVHQNEDGTSMRRLLVSPHPMYEAGERVGGRLGQVVDNPNVEQMIATVYGQPAVTA